MEPATPPEAPWRSGIEGARANLLPGVVLQLGAVALVLGYYHVAPLHGALDRLMAFRETAGFAFGIVSTGLFGGVLPFLYIHFSRAPGATRPQYDWAQGLWLTLFWAYKGFEVDVWYRVQAVLCGGGHDVGTVAIKVFLDQFVYCPAVAVPVTTIVYAAVAAHGWNPGLSADLRAHGWYRRRVLPVLISNLGVWVPAVAVIYCLPTPLQLPLQNIVLCFYTLVVAHQTRSRGVPRVYKQAAAGLASGPP